MHNISISYCIRASGTRRHPAVAEAAAAARRATCSLSLSLSLSGWNEEAPVALAAAHSPNANANALEESPSISCEAWMNAAKCVRRRKTDDSGISLALRPRESDLKQSLRSVESSQFSAREHHARERAMLEGLLQCALQFNVHSLVLSALPDDSRRPTGGASVVGPRAMARWRARTGLACSAAGDAGSHLQYVQYWLYCAGTCIIL